MDNELRACSVDPSTRCTWDTSDAPDDADDANEAAPETATE